MKLLVKLLVVLQIAVVFPLAVFSQGASRGTVTGKVVNSSGAAVAAIIVVTSEVAPSYKAKVNSDAEGNFSVADAPAGKVIVSAVNANGVVRASTSATLADNGGAVNVVIKIPAGK